MWPYDRKRIALLKEFYIDKCPVNDWGRVSIPEPVDIMDSKLLPHLLSVRPYEDYQLAKSLTNEFLEHKQFVRRIDWQQLNRFRFHWCAGVLKDNSVVIFQLNYEDFREYDTEKQHGY